MLIKFLLIYFLQLVFMDRWDSVYLLYCDPGRISQFACNHEKNIEPIQYSLLQQIFFSDKTDRKIFSIYEWQNHDKMHYIFYFAEIWFYDIYSEEIYAYNANFPSSL